MDSSIENALLDDALKELGKDGLLKAMAEARAESDAALIKHLLNERECKQQAEHGRKPDAKD